MPNIYESTIGPILEAAKSQGASKVFMTGGRVPFLMADGGFVRLEGHPPVLASDLELFLQEFGFAGSLGGRFRFTADRTARGDAGISFRILPQEPGSTGDLPRTPTD